MSNPSWTTKVDGITYKEAINMENKLKPVPWHFTIVFDEDKAMRNGYDVDTLYDYVGENVEPLGNIRIGRGSWQAKSREVQFGAQCPAVAMLVKQPWVMMNIKSLTTYEDMNEPDGEDYLAIVRRTRPELILG